MTPGRRLAALATAVLMGGAAPLLPAEAVPLAGHHAMYNLKLDTDRDTTVQAATGTMDYEMQDTCDGWATRQRLEMTVTSADGQNIHTLSDYTTYETKNGRKMRFRMRQVTDEAVTSDIEGSAELGASGGTAHFTLPKVKTMSLPQGTLFPTQHTETILAGASAGKKFLALPLFDGTTEKGAQDSSIVVTKWGGPMPSKWPALAALPGGNFHLAFFNRAASAAQPDYEVSMHYYDNGVANNLAMNFGDFTMDGTIVSFKLLPSGC